MHISIGPEGYIGDTGYSDLQQHHNGSNCNSLPQFKLIIIENFRVFYAQFIFLYKYTYDRIYKCYYISIYMLA